MTTLAGDIFGIHTTSQSFLTQNNQTPLWTSIKAIENQGDTAKGTE